MLKKINQVTKMLKLICVIITVSFIFLACDNKVGRDKEDNFSASSDIIISNEKNAMSDSHKISGSTEVESEVTKQDISINNPITFSTYQFDEQYPNYKNKTLIIEMVNGSYDRTQEFWSRTWSGTFQFRVSKDWQSTDDVEIRKTDKISCPVEMSFNKPFELVVDDYNNDKKPDFAISQFGSFSGGDYCAIFTVKSNGEVEMLPFEYQSKYISMFGTIAESNEKEDGSGQNAFIVPFRHLAESPKLQKVGEGEFCIEYYANHGFSSVNMLFDEKEENTINSNPEFAMPSMRDVYKWDGSAFYLQRQEVLNQNGTLFMSSDKRMD